MAGILDFVERASHASGEVKKGITSSGLQRHLYPFEPRQKQIDAIWHLVFKKEDLLLAANISFGKSVTFQAAPLFLALKQRCPKSTWRDVGASEDLPRRHKSASLRDLK
jgi:hypothetical protein